jgi:hypothetical protein
MLLVCVQFRVRMRKNRPRCVAAPRAHDAAVWTLTQLAWHGHAACVGARSCVWVSSRSYVGFSAPSGPSSTLRGVGHAALRAPLTQACVDVHAGCVEVRAQLREGPRSCVRVSAASRGLRRGCTRLRTTQDMASIWAIFRELLWVQSYCNT